MVGNSTAEQIDERILGLLGLEDEYEMSYEEYVRHLKEAMVASRMSESKFSTEESELITNEWKRIKDKKGRFKPKKKKITVEGLGIGKGFTDPLKINQQKLLLPGVSKDTQNLVSFIKKVGDQDKKDSGDNVLLRISSTLDSILQTFTDLNKENRKRIEKERIDAEQKARSEKEKQLESKPFEKIKKAFDIITKPFQSIWDIFANFIKNVILGRIVVKLLDWFGDPKNQGKVKSLTRFLVDFGPALLAGFVLFGTRFGKAVRFLSSIVLKGIWRLSKFAIPKILKFITRNPIAAGIALVTAGAWVPAMFPGTVNEQETKTQKTPGTSEDKIKALEKQKANLNVFEKLQGKGSEIDEQIEFLKTGKTKSYGFSGGGLSNYGKMFGGSGFNPTPTLIESENQEPKSNGFVSGQQGVDKVPAMLSDGEFVMSVGAVNKYGVETLEAMNAAGGGTNKPKIMGGKTYAAEGGRIGRYPRDTGEGERRSNYGNSIEDVKKILINVDKWFQRQGINIQDPKTWQGTANKFASNSLNQINKTATEFGNAGINVGTQAQRYLQGGELQKDVLNLANTGINFGAGLQNQAIKYGNQALSYVQSGKLQNQVSQVATQASQIPKKSGIGFFDAMKNISSSKSYQENANRAAKVQDGMINLSDSFIKKLPDGPFKDIADKGLIPIPSGNVTMMRNLTFLKAVMGPLGKPFKILSNKEVDNMRRQTIEQTMSKNGLNVDPKTGQVSMNWNQEDINKGGRGGGAYSDKVSGGSVANSILGRFSASTKPGGNVLYSDDRYNFNKSVGEYAEMAKQELMKGSFSDATYFGASMLGRFAQDIEWLNQRALGSEIEIGRVDRSKLDPRTGKPKTPAQLSADRTKAIAEEKRIQRVQQNQKALEAKRPWWDKMGMFGGASAQIKNEQKKKQEFLKRNPKATLYGPNDPRRKNTGQPYKSRFSRPTTAAKPPVKPPAKPKPRVVVAGGGMRGGRGSGSNRSGSATIAPSFKPNHGRTNTAAKTLGVNRK